MTAILYPAPLDDRDLKEAAKILRSGGTVVFPTETVYGLGADAFSDEAARSIFEAKGRPSDNPLIVHISHMEMLNHVVSEVPDAAVCLFSRFSPGPLTLVLPKNKNIPASVTAGLSTVAVRIPSHPVAQKLLEYTGIPIAAPSANRSGRPSPTTYAMAVSEMNGRANAIIDGGDCRIGLESTVAEVTSRGVKILRPGAITEEMIREALDGLDVISSANQESFRPASPGMKYAHYQPKAEVYITASRDGLLPGKLFGNKKIGVLTLRSDLSVPEGAEVIRFGGLDEYARGLYKSFADMDDLGVEIILAEAVEERELGSAIMNRLRKASAGKKFL